MPSAASNSDGTHSFTATAGHTSVDVASWTLSSLTITPTNHRNSTLSPYTTLFRSDGNLSTTTTNTEAVTVNPTAPTVAPVAATGVEGTAIALNLGTTVTELGRARI